MRIRLVAVALLACVASGAMVSSAEQPRIFAPASKLEQVFSGGFWLEGPAVASDGSVYFSDLTYSNLSGMQAGHIWRYDPQTGATTIFRSPSGMANGIAFDARGDMIVAEGADFGGRRITRTDMKTGRAYILAATYNGRPFNSPNDVAIDRQGRVYFTDPRYVGREPIEQPVMGIYRIDAGGDVTLLAANLWKPNGIALAPDERTLYVVEVGDYNANIVESAPSVGGPPSAIHAYDLMEDGRVRYRRAIITFPPDSWADGMAVDTRGNIFVGVGGPASLQGVHVYSPEGQKIDFLSTPETAVNIDFGRSPDSDVLYVVCARHPSGSGPWTPPATNGLYRVQLERSRFARGPDEPYNPPLQPTSAARTAVK